MKKSLFVVAAWSVIGIVLSSRAQAQVEPPKPPLVKVPVKFKTVAPSTVKAGDHIVIDATTAKGKVEFLYDLNAFPKERATLVGKMLVLSTGVNGTYTIGVVSYDDGTTEKIVVKVTGGLPTPPIPDPPTPTDPLEKIAQSVASLQKSFDAFVLQQTAANAAFDKRLAALEQIKPIPPPPVDPLIASFQTAYIADGKPAASLASLTAIYRQSGTAVNDPNNKTPADIFNQMHKAMAIVLKEPDPAKVTIMVNTRKAIAAELDKSLPLGPASIQPLDTATRAAISAQFGRVQKALEGVTP